MSAVVPIGSNFQGGLTIGSYGIGIAVCVCAENATPALYLIDKLSIVFSRATTHWAGPRTHWASTLCSLSTPSTQQGLPALQGIQPLQHLLGVPPIPIGLRGVEHQ